MRRPVIACFLAALCSAVLHADVTVTTVTTMEGGASAMMGGVTPKVVMRIKGMKARADIDVMGQNMSTLADLATKQMILLRPDQKTAQVIQRPAQGAAAGAATPVQMPKVDGTFKPTGKTQMLEGASCDEYTFTISMSMSEMAGQAPPEAAAAMQDMRMSMTGSMWLAKNGPGAAEYGAFQKAAMNAQLSSILTGMAAGMSSGGMERLMSAMSGAEGMPYLTEMTMTFEGTGPAVEMLKQMGAMKVTSKVTSVSTATLPDDLFVVPPDYQMIKQ